MSTSSAGQYAALTRDGHGWIPYRVVSTGRSHPVDLDDADIRIGPPPTPPTERSWGEYVLEFLPAIGLLTAFLPNIEPKKIA